jgi:Kdo2-lipid IVA lauroyltransferase/acyltransferase
MIGLFKLAALLPLWFMRGVGLALGWLVWAASSKYRRVMRENWQAAVKSGVLKMDRKRERILFRDAIGHAGLIAAELPKIWCDPKAIQKMSVSGLEPVLTLARAGRPMLFLTPHLGAFELSARKISTYFPLTVLYRPARQASLRRLMEALRPMPGLATAPANGSGVRQLLRALRAGEAVGMLPDQVPSKGDGVWAAFFGKPAYTMTLPIRLAKATQATLVWALAVRTQRGWHLDLSVWQHEAFTDLAPQQAAELMNQALMSQISRAPEQYLWAYNRYKDPGRAGTPRVIESGELHE